MSKSKNDLPTEHPERAKIVLTDAQAEVLREGLKWLHQHITESGAAPWEDYDPADSEVPGALTHRAGWEALINHTDDQLRTGA